MRKRCGLLVLVLLLSAAAHAKLVAEDQRPLGSRLPVILIHGWSSDASIWNAFAAAARQDPAVTRRCRLYRFSYDWKQPIADSAAQLGGELEDQPELRGHPVVLVGHSMGGLVARASIESWVPSEQGLDKVAAVITLATPHHGSPAADLDWLFGGSRWSVVFSLFPTGLAGLLDRIPLYRNLRTEGGHDLGWDNYDGSMPPELWLTASRYIRGLNEDLKIHPRRVELLRRYSLYAGYLTQIKPLSVLGLDASLRAGREWDAGASLLAHGLRRVRDEDGWPLNDGIVPLESACFLDDWGSFVRSPDGRTAVKDDWRDTPGDPRPPRAGIRALLPDVPHSQIASDPGALRLVLGELAGTEVDALAVTFADRPALYVPHTEVPRPLGLSPTRVWAAVGDPVAAPAPDRLVLRSEEHLSVVEPDSARFVARGVEKEWAFAPDGHAALLPDGSVVGITEPAFSQLHLGPVSKPLWSPNGRSVAYITADGLVLTHAEDLFITTLPMPAGWPRAWSANSSLLVASADDGLIEAAFRPDRALLALVVKPGHAVTGELVDSDGGRHPFTVTATGDAPALVMLRTRELTSYAFASPARGVTWAADASWLAWLGGADGNSLMVQWGDRPLAPVALPGAAPQAIASTPLGALVVVASTPDGGTALYSQDADGTVRELGRGPGAAVGAVVCSPSGRYAAVPLVGDKLLVVEVDGSWRTVVPGAKPLWLPIPAARSWTAEG